MDVTDTQRLDSTEWLSSLRALLSLVAQVGRGPRIQKLLEHSGAVFFFPLAAFFRLTSEQSCVKASNERVHFWRLSSRAPFRAVPDTNRGKSIDTTRTSSDRDIKLGPFTSSLEFLYDQPLWYGTF